MLSTKMKSRNDFQYDLLPDQAESNSITNEKNNKEKSTNSYPKDHILTIPFIWDGYDSFFTMVLIFFGLFTRFWVTHQPQFYTEFEIPTLKQVHHYLNKTFFVSNTPPFQQMVVSYLSREMLYDNSYKLNADYTFSDPTYSSLRSISAFFSMMSIPILYLILRCFGVKQFCSFCGGFFCLISQIMIVTMRNIDISGGVLFYSSMSILFSGLSHHFLYKSPQQIIFVFLQGIFAGFSFSSSFISFPILIFSAFWPFARFNSKIQSFTNIIICFSILYLSCLFHFLYTPIIQDYQLSQFNYSNFAQFKSIDGSYKKMELRHLSYAFHYMKLLFVDFVKNSFHNLNLSEIFRKNLMLEKWHVIWSKDDRFILCFTNKLVTFPAVIFAYLDLFHVCLNNFRFDAKRILSFLFILTTIWNSISYHPNNSGCYESYLAEYFGIIVFASFIENHLTPKDYGILMTFYLIVCGLKFLDWAPIIYAYTNPDPFFSPGIDLANLSNSTV